MIQVEEKQTFTPTNCNREMLISELNSLNQANPLSHPLASSLGSICEKTKVLEKLRKPYCSKMHHLGYLSVANVWYL